MKKQIPNALSVLRICIAIACFFLEPAYWVYGLIVAGLTDFLDGYLARAWSAQTTFGRIVDPIADKILVFVFGYIFWNSGLLRSEYIVSLIARDISIMLFSIYLLFRCQFASWKIQAIYCGKAVTMLQIFFFFCLCVHIPIEPILVKSMLLFGVGAFFELCIRHHKHWLKNFFVNQ